LARGTFHAVTLGCKLNQFDSAGLEGELARRGLAPVADPARADVVVVNTCTVTANADADARRLIRRLRRANPGCRLLVTGCYAERDAAGLAAIPGVDRVFGNRDKGRFPAILDELGVAPRAELAAGTIAPLLPAAGAGDRGCDGAATLPAAVHFGDRSRAFLKIQEGCRLACSYCIIPAVRGASRSVPAEAVSRSLAALFDAGYREVVLTGVNTGDWGRDLDPPSTLAALLTRLLASCGPDRRIRLNSLEPLTVTPEIVALFARERALARHLQVPLQSGCAAILRRMRRNYRLDQYAARLDALQEAAPDAGLGADVIVGFPGETEEMFEEGREFIARSPLSYLHVFSWSPRPGTSAAELPHRVSPATVQDRSRRLRALGDDLGYRFRRRFEGERLEAVVLAPRADGTIRALTGNFIEVAVEGRGAMALRRGELAPVRVTRVTREETRAVVE
jgi:threonylcarbamoyladenosine tRNA methylthiotransferase MtaB